MHPREFHGEAAADSPASVDDCFALLAAVERYGDWCSDMIREVEVLERGAGSQPTRVRMTMHIGRGPLVRTFNLFLRVIVEPPRIVKLRRVTDHPTNQEFDAIWSVSPGDSTRITLQLDAKLRVPWYIRAHGAGDAIASWFVEGACNRLGAAQQAQHWTPQPRGATAPADHVVLDPLPDD